MFIDNCIVLPYLDVYIKEDLSCLIQVWENYFKEIDIGQVLFLEYPAI